MSEKQGPFYKELFCILEGKRLILHNLEELFCILEGKRLILHNFRDLFCILE